jgi:4-amino-4-deoxy-L-arabinose transferase-like glycosyltransferase
MAAQKTIKISAAIIICLYAMAVFALWANRHRGNPDYFSNCPIVYDKFPESDFLIFWATSSLALSGQAAAAYNPKQLFQAEARVPHPQNHRRCLYPPTYFLLILPLSFLPFMPSLFLWCTATLAGYVAVLKRIFPHPLTVWLSLAFPAFFHNFVRGQNGFLSGIFFGGGLFLLDHYPSAAGLLLGLMVFKPQLALLIPLALLAGRHWRALGGFAASALGMILLSLAAFGSEAWLVFFRVLVNENKALLIQGAGFIPFNLTPTVLSAAALMGMELGLASWLHWTVAFVAAAAAVWTWYRGASLKVRASTLIVATLLFSPRLLIYDSCLLAAALAFLGSELITPPFSPGRLAIFASVWMMPFLAPILATQSHLQIGPVVLLLLFSYILYGYFSKDPANQMNSQKIIGLLRNIKLYYLGFIAKRRNIRPWVLLIFIVLLVAFVRIRLLDIPLERDEGEFAYAAQLILQDEPFYLSFYNYKLPGIYAAYTLIIYIFGQTVWGIHLALLLINALTIIVFFLITRKFFGAAVGLMAGAFFGLLSLGQQVTGFSANWEHFVLLPALAGFWLMLKGLETKRDRYFWGSGLLLGLSFLMRQHAAAFIVFAGLYFLGFQAIHRDVAWRLWARQLAIVILGTAGPFALTCLVMWLDGSFGRFWFMNFIYAPGCVGEISLAVGVRNFRTNITKIIAPAISIWCLAGIGLSSLAWDRDTRKEWLFVVLFTLFSFLSICPGYWFREHYFLLILPDIALLASLGIFSLSRLFRYIRERLIIGVSVLLFLIVLGYAIINQRQYLFQYDPLTISRLTYGLNPFIESLTIAEYLKKNTTKADRILVMGSEPQINFYSQRRSPTGYIFMDQLVQNHKYAEAMQREAISEVEAKPPKFIVFVDVPTSWCLTPESEKFIFRWMANYINRYYKLVGLVEILPTGFAKYSWEEQGMPGKRSSNFGCSIYRRK